MGVVLHDRKTSPLRVLLLTALAVVWMGSSAPGLAAQQSRCVAVEVYLHVTDPMEVWIRQALTHFTEQRSGISITPYDLDGDSASSSLERLRKVSEYYRIDASKTPIIYGCNQVIVNPSDMHELTSQLNLMLRIEVYVRTGCPKCAKAKEYLKRISQKYPGLSFQLRDIASDATARTKLEQLARDHRKAATSVPVFHLCDQLFVGFDSESTTGSRLEQILAPWTIDCLSPRNSSNDQSTESPHSKTKPQQSITQLHSGLPDMASMFLRFPSLSEVASVSHEPVHADDRSPPVPNSDNPATRPMPGLPIPGDSIVPSDTMDVPMLGPLSASQLGLPLFTIAVGLVDGFNPCAMWVLLFLLSILINLKDRWRILAVAGVFVGISGIAYFAFMAAWLNVFRWIGLLRPIQVTLAVVAIAVGMIHIKDFFAFKQGITLSIPESAKPGIYARVRRIVTAENLWGAIMGACVLAVMVNLIELLCTAGLPALYTEILTMKQLPQWQNYGYLALYNVAYMFDDSLMVGLVVVSLDRRKMQEKHGRILKLISGAVILALGVVMLIKPEWLV